MKAILIGRHAPDLGQDIEIVEQRAITWPATATACIPVLRELLLSAKVADIAVLFQNTPGQVAAALVREMIEYHGTPYDGSPPPGNIIGEVGVGVIVSVPGPRPGRVSRVFTLDDPLTGKEASIHMHAETQAAALFANPRAEVVSEEPGTVTVTVDGPPMPFTFSHIEWL